MSEKEARTKLFQYLDDVLSVSHKKFMAEKGKNAKNCERRAWARILKDSVLAYGKLLETSQLDELAKDVEEIKQKVGIK